MRDRLTKQHCLKKCAANTAYEVFPIPWTLCFQEGSLAGKCIQLFSPCFFSFASLYERRNDLLCWWDKCSQISLSLIPPLGECEGSVVAPQWTDLDRWKVCAWEVGPAVPLRSCSTPALEIREFEAAKSSQGQLTGEGLALGSPFQRLEWAWDEK